MSDRGASGIALIVLFGVVLAIATAVVFALFYERQLETRVVGQAQDLADELATTAFSALGGSGQPTLDLPLDVGGSVYELSIRDNNTFVVRITAGRLKGEEFSSIINSTVQVEDPGFTPGEKVYFQRAGDAIIIVSASSVQAPQENVEIAPPGEPPEFYYFARENQREATAIATAYFHALEDITAYKWQDTNTLLVRLKNNSVLQVRGYENMDDVGYVDKTWIVQQVENFTSEFTGAIACPSVENAHQGGWFYSPSQALVTLRSRSWRRMIDNVAVTVPSDAVINAAAVTTNVGTFPAYRVTFENYVIFYRAMAWWYAENTPGFVFQSEPELEPIA